MKNGCIWNSTIEKYYYEKYLLSAVIMPVDISNDLYERNAERDVGSACEIAPWTFLSNMCRELYWILTIKVTVIIFLKITTFLLRTNNPWISICHEKHPYSLI